jgi:hypothetical protein
MGQGEGGEKVGHRQAGLIADVSWKRYEGNPRCAPNFSSCSATKFETILYEIFHKTRLDTDIAPFCPFSPLV